MTADERYLKSVPYEIFILLVSLLSIANFLATSLSVSFGVLSGPAGDVVVLMDVALTPIFLADFVFRFATASSRRGYFIHGGWLDLLAVIPLLRFLRAVAIVRTLRALRRMGASRIALELDERRAAATFLTTIFLVFVVVEIAGATIYAAEVGDSAANIRSAGDGLWWGLVTITTVGYGDRYPVTPQGRIIGVFLLFAGIALFSVLTGFIANVFLAPHRRRLSMRADATGNTIMELRNLLTEQEQRTAEIKRRIDELERSMTRPEPPV